jgi:hypothetical protein
MEPQAPESPARRAKAVPEQPRRTGRARRALTEVMMKKVVASGKRGGFHCTETGDLSGNGGVREMQAIQSLKSRDKSIHAV